MKCIEIMEDYQSADLFNKNGYIHVKNVLDKNICNFLTHVLLRKSSQQIVDDDQVPNCIATMDHEIMFETILEKIWSDIEYATGKKLLPTYAYSRLYVNGNVLERHSDREECEISVTLQLGRSHHYAWPIFMNGKRCDLGEGDAVIYKGCDLDHWRNACDGPDGYYSGQVFLHFVDANGPYSDRACDIKNRKSYPSMFVKNRDLLMENK
jgi:hypothetical protein